MEQPPLIDVEPEDGENSRLSKLAGCLGRLLPLAVGALVLLIVLMAATILMWGDHSQEGAAGGSEPETTEKTGLAGMMDKVKRAVKGDPAPKEKTETAEATVTGEGGSGDPMKQAVNESIDLADSIGAEGKSPEERNRLIKEKFGHLEEDKPESAGGQGTDGIIRTSSRRGGSFGSSIGEASVTGAANQYQRWRGDFATSGSDLEFEIIYQEAGGQLQFRCFVMPYDSQTAQLFRGDKGDFLLSFHSAEGRQMVPPEGAVRIPLTKLTAFENGGEVSGWVARGMIPLGAEQVANLQTVKLAWDFDKELADWLKALKGSRSR